MSKMRVTIVLEFDDIQPGSPEDEQIIEEITSECERIQIGFDAQGCWVDDAVYLDDSTTDES